MPTFLKESTCEIMNISYPPNIEKKKIGNAEFIVRGKCYSSRYDVPVFKVEGLISMTTHILNQAGPWDVAVDVGSFRCASSNSVFPYALSS